MRRDFLDAAFSDLVREAWDWTCARCHKPFPERKGQDCHCSHFISRGAGNATRWNLDNAVCLCGSCHDWVGKRPDEHTAFFRRVIGDVRYQDLQLAKHKTVKLTEADKKAMAKWYRLEQTRIEAERWRGVVGYVQPVPWDSVA